MMIISAKLFKKNSGLKVMERTRNVDFLTLTLKCDLYHRGSNPSIAPCTLFYNGIHLCQVFFHFHYQRFKSYGADSECTIFNTWPSSLTLTFGTAIQLVRSVQRLIMVITCANLFQKYFSGSWHKSVTDGEGHSYNPLLAMRISWYMYCNI
jgi:hypothetical protein